MMNFGMKGEYRLVVKRANGTEDDTGWFPNVILNQGLDRLGNSGGGTSPIINYAQVGTGNSTPVITQTSLDAFLGASNVTNAATSAVNSGSPNYITTLTYSYTFAQGSVVGNISEVGIGWGNTASPVLFSRALILDGGASPTTLTLVSIDQLIVFYRLTMQPTLTDTGSSILISPTTYNYTTRVAQVGSFAADINLLSTSNFFLAPSSIIPYAPGATLGPITGLPAGTSGSAGTGSAGSYTPGSYFKDQTFTFTVTQGNVGGTQALLLLMSTNQTIRYQILFDATIPKTSSNTLSIVFRFSWTRI